MIFVRCKAIHNPVISSKWKSFLMILHVELSRERSNRPNRLVLPADDKLSAMKKLENKIVNQFDECIRKIRKKGKKFRKKNSEKFRKKN